LFGNANVDDIQHLGAGQISLPFLPCCHRTRTENFRDFLFLEERKDEHNIGQEIYNKITLVIIISNF